MQNQTWYGTTTFHVELICGPKLTQLFLINPGCLCFEASSLYVKIKYNQTLKDKLFKS